MRLNESLKNTIIVEGKNYLTFTGTSYLGLHQLETFKQQLFLSLQKWGASYGSSRKANLQLAVYDDGENLLAKLLQTEKAVTTSSGTLSGILTIQTLQKNIDLFFHMPKTHPSILPEESKLINNADNLFKTIKNKKVAIITDAIATLETAPYNFDFINKIAVKNEVFLVVDLSHYIGIYNTFSPFTLSNVRTIYTASLGKAYGINGGVIAGDTIFIDKLMDNPTFKGAAGMSPAFLDCFIKSQSIYKEQQHKLQEHCNFLHTHLNHFSMLKTAKNYPVLFHSNPKLATFLSSNNIIITSFYYATQTQKLNRIVINAEHKKEELNKLMKKLHLFDK